MAGRKNSKLSTVDQVKEKYAPEIMAIPGVTGIGIGNSDRKTGLAIKVYVERMTPELKRRIPAELEGYPVIAETTGEFRAL
jgi:hypothetical protein